VSLRIDLVVTSGVFALDGAEFEVDDNIWILGGQGEVIVIDAGHDHARILAGVGGRTVTTIVLTHGHNDHINSARALADACGAPIAMHRDDGMLWDEVYPGSSPDVDLADGDTVAVAGQSLSVIHTPGHTPGAISLYDGDGHLFAGDTLFKGGPGATGRKYSDFDTIIDSIRTKLLTLPPDTTVFPGHGETTTIATEAPHLQEWIDRGS
jgi:glyoxylase-like metal-dependent hydrolase (beta-lactamase superfamily II)